MKEKTMTSRDRVLACIEGKETDCLPLMPITMMFAADRVGVKYYDYATDYRELVEAQLCTADEFDFDFVSAISDPTREAADCGAEIEYFEDQPPAIVENRARLSDKTELAGLKIPDPLGGGRMHDRVKAAELFKRRVGDDKLIEGWIEGPCAQAADLRGINTLMLDLVDDPTFVRDLFEFVVEMELRFARAQVDAGADLIGMGDAAASLIGPVYYEELVWPYEKKLIDGLHEMGNRVRLHICGHTKQIFEGIGRLGCDIVDLDWMAPIDEARRKMGPDQVLLGNIDPVAVLHNGTPDSVYKTIAECHRQAGSRYIVSAGCEVVRDTPEQNVQALTDYARSN
ncbi:MAG: uroporphyrinogen decarboxylase family protein [Planctomycetota bacterium]|nr:MAG: uroporphyrinogen decarboxylase family protein [Planctomycetota bacterium]